METWPLLRDSSTGAAWLSSARVVRCWVKSRNERNPCLLLLTGDAEDSAGTAGDKPEDVGTTSSHHGPYVQGYTRATMAGTNRSIPRGGANRKNPV